MSERMKLTQRPWRGQKTLEIWPGWGRWWVERRLGQTPRKWTRSCHRKASSRRVRGEERIPGVGAEGRAGAQWVWHLCRGSRVHSRRGGPFPQNLSTSQVPWRDLAPSGDRVNGKNRLFISIESAAVPGPRWKHSLCLTLTYTTLTPTSPCGQDAALSQLLAARIGLG